MTLTSITHNCTGSYEALRAVHASVGAICTSATRRPGLLAIPRSFQKYVLARKSFSFCFSIFFRDQICHPYTFRHRHVKSEKDQYRKQKDLLWKMMSRPLIEKRSVKISPVVNMGVHAFAQRRVVVRLCGQ